MYFALPEEYRISAPDELKNRIKEAKTKLGNSAFILAHHYQRAEIVEFGDAVGDSFALSKIAAENANAEYIFFCGVHFMAEAAEILSTDKQTVFLPNPLAGCPMADMAEMDDVLLAWETLENFGGDKKIMPVSYMNSTAALKGFTGEHGGLICTSSNADAVYKYGFSNREKLFFFPDQHLGYNTGIKYGLKPEDMVVWDFSLDNGGLTNEQLDKAKIILWKGHCHVHTNFTAKHIEETRMKFPDVKIVVHPECPHEVVKEADAFGSTSFIVNFVEKQPPGSNIAIGTEINLINRLGMLYPDKNIFELSGTTCPVCANMYRTTINDLAYCLENFKDIKPIQVPEDVKVNARIALERMLAVH